MESTIRFPLDESVNHAVAQCLRSRGVDVTTTTDAGLLHAADPEQLDYALRETRVLVTHDQDFLQIHSAIQTQAGIAYCHQDKYCIGQLVHRLVLLGSCCSAAEMVGRLEYL